ASCPIADSPMSSLNHLISSATGAIRSLSSSTYSNRPAQPALPFPTRRSSDLAPRGVRGLPPARRRRRRREPEVPGHRGLGLRRSVRKSTRLNSSHVSISYAVFCLKKKIEWCNEIVRKQQRHQ